MKFRFVVFGLGIAVASGIFFSRAAGKQDSHASRSYPHFDRSFFRSLTWRSIGPPRAGRAPAVGGDARNALVFYMGAAGGGVWKTYDAGTYWQNISDGFFTTASVGALAVSESDPNVIYAGTGEICTHPDIENGDGVYKSTDAGKTWVHLGLKDSEHIGKIVVDPRDPNIVFVAAMGHHFGYNRERGVYRSRDGGRTWQQVLYKDDKTGAADLSMDATNPNTIYASMYQLIRQPWSELSGGPQCGLYKSTNGGDTWRDISRNPGMPKGVLGKIGVALSPARPTRVYAIIEAAEGGIFRSDDSGATWQLANNQRDYRFLASSYSHIIADTKDPDTIYVPWMQLLKSTDGGHTLTALPMPHSDHHALWIDPNNPKRMIEGSDGGAIVTLNGGNSWSSQYNQPTAELFHAAVDTQYPYRVYATQMDSTAISVPSKTHESAIKWKDCYPAGTAESGSIAVRADNPNIVFAGSIGSSGGGGGNLLRYDRRTLQQTMITVWPEDQYGSPLKDVKYRFHFTYPVVLSPHNPNVLYVAANKVFRSTNEGKSWEAISPDLTRNDQSKMQEIDGGPITSQKFSSQYSSVIFALAESRLKEGELWAGSDDGEIHLTQDGGKSWQNVSPKDLPDWTNISTIEVSPHHPGTAYVAANRHELDDKRPYFLKTADYGKTWHSIHNGIREGDFARVIREDPVRRGLLYAGTETGAYVSFDGGDSWQSLQLNLPAVPVHDLIVKDNALVAATHGRAFWILDNLTVLREMNRDVAESTVHLFTVDPTYRLLGGEREGVGGQAASFGPDYLRISGDGLALRVSRKADGSIERSYLNAGSNPPNGVIVTYYLKRKPEGEVSITFVDANNHVIRKFVSAAQQGGREARVSADAGTNQFVWDMAYPGAKEIPSGRFLPLEWAHAMAPIAPPGTYKVRLRAGGEDYEQAFEIRKDPRVTANQQDLEAQFALMLQIHEKLGQLTDAVNQIRKLRSEIEEAAHRAASRADSQTAVAAASRLKERLTGIEGTLTRLLGPNPMFVPPKTLNIKLAALTVVVESSDAAPTQQTVDVFNDLSGRLSTELTQLNEITTQEVPNILGALGSSE